MKKILSLTFVAMLSVALAAPAYAGRGHGGGFHGGHHGGFHHGGGFHGGCCWGGAFVGAVFVGSAFVYPYYGYAYYAYPSAYPMYAEPAYQPQTQVTVAPSVQRDVCYTDGCYHLQGDGVTVAYSWVWVPAAPAPPPGPPSRWGTRWTAPASVRRGEGSPPVPHFRQRPWDCRPAGVPARWVHGSSRLALGGEAGGRYRNVRGGGSRADSDDERDIMQCYDRRFKAMVRGDLTALRMALADSLTYAHSSRVHDTKAEFLDLLTRGQFIYKPIIPEARSVRVYGGAGIVTGTARMEITARGHDTRSCIRYLAVYVKAQDRWQMAAWQSRRVPEP